MKTTVAKRPSLLIPLSVIVLLGHLLSGTQAHAGEAGSTDKATFSQLFQPSCSGTGGCKNDCLNGDNPQHNYCECAAGNSSEWFTADTGATPSITIKAAATNEAYCRTVNTESTCRFNLGTGGVTHVSFDFVVSEACSQATAQGTEWLAFWMFNNPWNGHAEVDFIESRFGPSAGLNTNFDGNGNQVVIFPAGPATWRGSIRSKFSSTGSAVSVSVHNLNNNNIGRSTLNSSTGYFFVMDTAGGSQDSSCTITVSNLAVQGTVPGTLGGRPNCVGLPVTKN